MMRAVRVAAFGGPEVCQVQKIPIPQLTPGQVLVKVEAAGVNPIDTYIRSGLFAVKPELPYTPGKDAAGTVHQVLPGSKFKVGERVYCTAGGHAASASGAYAEMAAVPETLLWPLPATISYEQGAALGVPYHTAYRALFQKYPLTVDVGMPVCEGKLRCHTKPGETVLIHGASGGVGLAAVQIGKAAGFTVFGTAGTAEGLELVKGQGADAVFNHREDGYLHNIATAGGGGVDVILEMLANVNLNQDLSILHQNGRIAVIGSRGTVEVDPRVAMMKESSIIGVALMAASPAEWAESGSWLDTGMREGKLSPIIGGRYSMEEAGKAHHDIIHNAGTKGKIVITTQ